MSQTTKRQFARDLRQKQTDTEKTLWYYLRGRRLNGLKFKRQDVIHPYIVDFVCYEAMLIVELDGGQHNTPEKIAYDKVRTKFLEKLGFRVLRYWDNQVFNHLDEVLEDILAKSSISPSPQRRGKLDYRAEKIGTKQSATPDLKEEILTPLSPS